MSKNEVSAGLLMYRIIDGEVEYFLAHPGGPFFARKDEGAWGIPKGLADSGEDLLETAQREFFEETSIPVEARDFIPLGTVKGKNGKTIHGWAFVCSIAECPLVVSNKFKMQWPPNSGRYEEFPEVDRAEFFSYDVAVKKIGDAQRPFLDRLREALNKGV